MKKISFIVLPTLLLSLLLLAFVGAQEPERDPIVIVPGTMASWNLAVLLNPLSPPILSGWEFTPSIKQYDQLIQSFVDEGLVEGEDFFVAFYDWRRDNERSANEYLIPIIDEALAHSNTGKVDIVAHSMGGLVSRAYIQSDDYRDDVDQFIMLGTPNAGSSDVYTLWEGGRVPNNWDEGQKAALVGYAWFLSLTTPGTTGIYDVVHDFVPSIGELMATYDFLVEKDGGEHISVSSMQEQNIFLQNLNDDENKETLLANVNGGVSIIAGDGESTVGDIPVVPHNPAEDGKLWVDGKPDPLTPARDNTEGDNRVLLSSAFIEVDAPPPPILSEGPKNSTFIEKVANFFGGIVHAQIGPPPPFPGALPIYEQTLSARHSDLPTVAIPEIFSILGMDAPTIAYDPIPEPDEILTFWFASPIDVQITSPNGEVITKSSNNIPGATYDGVDDPLGFKMVLIENPQIGEYVVNLLGIGNGNYHMGVGSFTDTLDTDITVEGEVQENQNISYSVTYNEGENPINISDPVFEEEELSVNDLFALFRETVNASKMHKGLKKSLINRANTAERSYDRGNTRITKIHITHLEILVDIFKGWLIPNDDATVLLDILSDIKKEL